MKRRAGDIEARVEALEAAIVVIMRALEPKPPTLLEQSKRLAQRVRERQGRDS